MTTSVACTVERMRAALARPLDARQIASSIARAVANWRDRDYPRRTRAIAQIASRSGFSVAMLNESIDALLRPFSPESLEALARKVRHRPEIVGFVMAGNAAGAGIHEVIIALTAGAGVLIKSASSEPVFFAEFAATLAEIAPEIAARVAVFNWSREDGELTGQFVANADILLAYGDDSTIAALAGAGRFIGFGSRVSGVVLAPATMTEARLGEVVAKIALDATLYEQLGCLSPHHLFVLGPSLQSASGIAQRIAEELGRRAMTLAAPAHLPLQDAAAIRRVREIARWRAIAGERVELFEGSRLDWTVVCDHAASFSVSPGYRTLFVSAVPGVDELVHRLEPARRYLESIAIAAEGSAHGEIRAALEKLDVPRFCAPGEMQSPPLEWRHGGGAFLDIMTIPQ